MSRLHGIFRQPSHSGLPYVDLKDAPKKMIPFKLIETFKMNI